MNLGKLKKIELREGWKHEANDFTKWLAQEDNLRLLSDEIGFDIKLIQTEAKVGSFNVDILAEEETTGYKIIIENQLEITDHDHLGKIITYASGYDARVIVWVVKDVREEHRQAIDWLNENTNEEIGFYLLKIELWQIADSPFAPKFEIISKPNDWAKAVKSSVESSELTETKIKQLQFWDDFKSFAKQNNTKLRFQKSYPQHWTNISIGNSDCHLSLTINSRDGLLGVEIYISNNKELYSHIFNSKEKIESELGESLEWMELPNKKASRIKSSAIGNFEDESKWGNYFEWLLKEAERFQSIFPKYINN
ncbi:MAG: DUF4268 domain-containing protein [Candidatus Paceibacterota bacterium]